MPVGISLDEAKVIERHVRAVLLGYPEIRQVVTQLGRPDDGTDTKGSNNLEIYADLKPRGEWKNAHDKDALIALIEAKLDRIPGIELNFSQYIKDNVEEALSGVTGELVVKIFGPDLDVLQQKADDVQRVIAGVHGVADLGVEQQFGQPQLRVDFDRAAMARQGVAVADVNDAIETAIGGRAVTQFLDGDRAFDVRVRFTPKHATIVRRSSIWISRRPTAISCRCRRWRGRELRGCIADLARSQRASHRRQVLGPRTRSRRLRG